jgi:hypothetical protein
LDLGGRVNEYGSKRQGAKAIRLTRVNVQARKSGTDMGSQGFFEASENGHIIDNWSMELCIPFQFLHMFGWITPWAMIIGISE